jgi:FAD/FMN-containing dehydrogenase
MTHQLAREWDDLGIAEPQAIGQSADLWRRLIEFPAAGESPLVVKASVAASGTTAFLEAARRVDPQCSLQAHAGNGVVIVRFAKFPPQGLSRALIGDLLPIATAHQGQVLVLSNPGGAEMTHVSVWGTASASLDLMAAVKRKFDPQDILNRGRFVYS